MSYSRAPLRLALCACLATSVACAKPPEEQAAGHITALAELLEAHKDDPEEGVSKAHDYVIAHAPEILRALGEAIAEADAAAGGRGSSRQLIERWEAALEDPLDELDDALEEFLGEVGTDNDAAGELRALVAYYSTEVPELFDTALSEAGGDSSRGGSQRTRRAQTTEATMNVRRLFDGAVVYYDSDHVTAIGDILPPQFPASAPLTPPVIPCGQAAQPDPSAWDHPTWEALHFRVGDPHIYSYQFDSTGLRVGAQFTASAFGDLDCDGVISTFVRVGTVMPGNEIRGGAGLYVQQELE